MKSVSVSFFQKKEIQGMLLTSTVLFTVFIRIIFRSSDLSLSIFLPLSLSLFSLSSFEYVSSNQFYGMKERISSNQSKREEGTYKWISI